MRRVEGGHLHHGETDTAVVVQQLAAQGIRESADREFAGAIGRLQRDGAIGQRGTDLHDGARIPRPHMFQGRHGAVDVTQKSDFGHPAELLGRDFVEWREHGCHGAVHPHIDGVPFARHRIGGRFDGFGVRDIHRKGETPPARGFEIAPRLIQPRRIARNYRHIAATACELDRGCPAQPRRPAGDHDIDRLPVLATGNLQWRQHLPLRTEEDST